MNKIDLEVKKFIKKAESDSSLKACIERTMGLIGIPRHFSSC